MNKYHKENIYLSEIMWEIHNSLSVKSKRRQAEIMDLGSGTVSSLLQPSIAVRGLPDHSTIEKIAEYRGQKPWELYKEIEEKIDQRKITRKQRTKRVKGYIYETTDKDDLMELFEVLSSHMIRLHKDETKNQKLAS